MWIVTGVGLQGNCLILPPRGDYEYYNFKTDLKFKKSGSKQGNVVYETVKNKLY